LHAGEFLQRGKSPSSLGLWVQLHSVMVAFTLIWQACCIAMVVTLVLATRAQVHAQAVRDGSGSTYRAMSVQHSPLGAFGSAAEDIYRANLQAYEHYLEDHADAQIAVFPEYGLGNIFGGTRKSMKPFCEQVDVGTHYCSSETEGGTANEQLAALSCMAEKHGTVVVVDMCDVQSCSNHDGDSRAHCPEDGELLFNTMVALDAKGIVVAKYHKSHLFGEQGVFDQPERPFQPVSFDSGFGVTMGMFVCFDLDFAAPVLELVERGVQDFVFASYWVNQPPYSTATMYQQAWAAANHVNLIASNTGMNAANAGSGIYAADGTVGASHFDMGAQGGDDFVAVYDLPSPSGKRLPVWGAKPTELPRGEPLPRGATPKGNQACLGPGSNGQFMHGVCSMFSSSQTTQGTLTVANGTTTCHLSYKIQHVNPGSSDRWVLFAYDGVMNYSSSDSLPAQCCFLSLCNKPAADEEETCSGHWAASHTVFSSAQLTAEFRSQHTDPQVVLSSTAVGDAQVVQQTDTQALRVGRDRVQHIATLKGGDEPLWSMMMWLVAP
jgi:predicted amidohydrolase